MAQNWVNNDEGAGGDTVKQGMINLEQKLDTVRSQFSGTAFPTDDDRVVGQPCWRTDGGAPSGIGLYRLTVKDPTPANDTWIFVMGDSGITTFAETLLDDANAAAARTTLGLGTVATLASGTGSGDVRTNTQNDSRFAQTANNLSDLASASTARTNLGLGSLATLSSVGTAQLGSDVVTRAKCETTQKLFTHVAKSAAYTANAQEFVTATVSTNWTLTLPASPSSGQRVGAYCKSVGSGKILTIDGGTKNIGSGSTTLKLYATDDLIVLAYNGSEWTIESQQIANHYCQISLDAMTSPSASAWGQILLDTVDFDRGGLENVSANRIDIVRAGNYRVGFSGYNGQVGTAGNAYRIKKNGSVLTPHIAWDNVSDWYPSGESNVALVGPHFERIYSLAAADYLTLEMYGVLDTVGPDNQAQLWVEEIR